MFKVNTIENDYMTSIIGTEFHRNPEILFYDLFIKILPLPSFYENHDNNCKNSPILRCSLSRPSKY